MFHIGFHYYSRLISILGSLYTPIAHQVSPVSLVDSVTAKVGDEKIYLAYIIYILNSLFINLLYIHMFLYTFCIHLIHSQGQDEAQKVATRKVEDGQETLFPKKCLGTFGLSFAIITDSQEQV